MNKNFFYHFLKKIFEESFLAFLLPFISTIIQLQVPNDLIKSSLDDGEIIIKLSSSSETTTSRSLSKETSQSTTKTSSATTGIESKPWAPVAPTSQSSTTEISTKSFVKSFEKSEEISHQKSKPETPKPRAKKSENQVQVVEPEPPAKPERHLKPDTTATKPEAATPKLAKKEPEIKPVKSKVTQVPILKFFWSSRSQFHQYFTRAFFLQKSFRQLFSSYM